MSVQVTTPYRKQRDREAAQVECPECLALRRLRCVTRFGKPRAPHPIRRRARASATDLAAADA